jgi:hypothetical protein
MDLLTLAFTAASLIECHKASAFRRPEQAGLANHLPVAAVDGIRSEI